MANQPEDKLHDTARELQERFGGLWGEHPDFPLEDWQYEVAQGFTRFGYWEWIVSRQAEREVAWGTLLRARWRSEGPQLAGEI